MEVGRKKEKASEAPARARASSFAHAQKARGRCLPTRWVRPAGAHPLPWTEEGATARTPALPRCDRGGEGGVSGEALPRSYRVLTWRPSRTAATWLPRRVGKRGGASPGRVIEGTRREGLPRETGCASDAEARRGGVAGVGVAEAWRRALCVTCLVS